MRTSTSCTGEIQELAGVLEELADWHDSVQREGVQETTRRRMRRVSDLCGRIREAVHPCIGLRPAQPAVGRVCMSDIDPFRPGAFRRLLTPAKVNPLSRPDALPIREPIEDLPDDAVDVLALVEEASKHVGLVLYWGSKRGELSDRDTKRRQQVFEDCGKRLQPIAELLRRYVGAAGAGSNGPKPPDDGDSQTEPDEGSDDQADSGKPRHNGSGPALVGPVELARMNSLPLERLRGRLKRLRGQDHGSFMEVADRKPRDPQYLYRTDHAGVQKIIKDLKRQTTSERPAK